MGEIVDKMLQRRAEAEFKWQNLSIVEAERKAAEAAREQEWAQHELAGREEFIAFVDQRPVEADRRFESPATRAGRRLTQYAPVVLGTFVVGDTDFTLLTKPFTYLSDPVLQTGPLANLRNSSPTIHNSVFGFELWQSRDDRAPEYLQDNDISRPVAPYYPDLHVDHLFHFLQEVTSLAQ